MTQKITFVGWYGRQNAGDEAFKEVHKLLFNGRCDIEWADDKAQVTTSPGQRYVLGGGDVLNNFYAKHIPADQPFALYGVGVGGEEEFGFISQHQDRIPAAWVRNDRDAQRLVASGLNAHFTPDIVFQLKSLYADSKARDPAGAAGRKRLVLFLSANAFQDALRTGNERLIHYYGFFQRELALVCDFLSDYYDVVFYPLSTNVNDDDHLFSTQVHGFMRKAERARVLPGRDEIEEIVQMVKAADLVMTMKFHGIVFSILSERPFVNVGLSRKTQLLSADNGLGQLSLDPYCMSYHKAAAAIKHAESPAVRQQVAEVSRRLYEQASAQGQAFRDFILGS